MYVCILFEICFNMCVCSYILYIFNIFYIIFYIYSVLGANSLETHFRKLTIPQTGGTTRGVLTLPHSN